jgi:hypothetical protein
MTQATTQAAAETQDLTDGFHLVIDALKLNGITTIYGVPASRSRISAGWRKRRASAFSHSGMSRMPAMPRRSPVS